MRDSTKVIIGLGSIWGLYALGATVIGSFTIGANDTAPEIVGLVLYGFTLLPACILAIWYRKPTAIWLIALAFISVFGFIYQILEEAGPAKEYRSLPRDLGFALFMAAIPGLLGILLLRSVRREKREI
ncbi:hypothetical protein RBB79_03270 [Tunturiibacter empetritectus]|uniref:Uncharacterized protein n=2 Tax=Tunturiibacter TaxID=3154218 RepID=A0A852VA24_9BACT|nr:hypothetical protein [Edaphobacter lichenicola]NYF88530.1 hypothetical protein [Edaphobacter lichenicola]